MIVNRKYIPVVQFIESTEFVVDKQGLLAFLLKKIIQNQSTELDIVIQLQIDTQTEKLFSVYYPHMCIDFELSIEQTDIPIFDISTEIGKQSCNEFEQNNLQSNISNLVDQPNSSVYLSKVKKHALHNNDKLSRTLHIIVPSDVNNIELKLYYKFNEISEFILNTKWDATLNPVYSNHEICVPDNNIYPTIGYKVDQQLFDTFLTSLTNSNVQISSISKKICQIILTNCEITLTSSNIDNIPVEYDSIYLPTGFVKVNDQQTQIVQDEFYELIFQKNINQLQSFMFFIPKNIYSIEIQFIQEIENDLTGVISGIFSIDNKNTLNNMIKFDEIDEQSTFFTELLQNKEIAILTTDNIMISEVLENITETKLDKWIFFTYKNLSQNHILKFANLKCKFIYRFKKSKIDSLITSTTDICAEVDSSVKNICEYFIETYSEKFYKDYRTTVPSSFKLGDYDIITKQISQNIDNINTSKKFALMQDSSSKIKSAKPKCLQSIIVKRLPDYNYTVFRNNINVNTVSYKSNVTIKDSLSNIGENFEFGYDNVEVYGIFLLETAKNITLKFECDFSLGLFFFRPELYLYKEDFVNTIDISILSGDVDSLSILDIRGGYYGLTTSNEVKFNFTCSKSTWIYFTIVHGGEFSGLEPIPDAIQIPLTVSYEFNNEIITSTDLQDQGAISKIYKYIPDNCIYLIHKGTESYNLLTIKHKGSKCKCPFDETFMNKLKNKYCTVKCKYPNETYMNKYCTTKQPKFNLQNVQGECKPNITTKNVNCTSDNDQQSQQIESIINSQYSNFGMDPTFTP